MEMTVTHTATVCWFSYSSLDFLLKVYATVTIDGSKKEGGKEKEFKVYSQTAFFSAKYVKMNKKINTNIC